MCKKKSFLKVGIIYTVGQVLSKAISFLLLPIYTRELGTIGYGKLSLADTVMDFISTFLMLGIFSGYIRFYREYSEEQKNKLRNTAINFALILAIFDILIFITFGERISKIIFNFNNSYLILMLVVLRSLLTQFVVLLTCDYTLNYQAIKMVIINLCMLIMNLLLSIFLVVYKKQGIIGVYTGYIYSASVVLIYLVIKNIKNYKFQLDKSMLKNMLTFSGGLIPCNLSGTILTLADRYFLAGYRSYSETGIYSIGYKFGMLINPLFIDPFKSIFTPYKFEVWKDEDAEFKFNEMFRKYHFIGCFIILGITLYGRLIINIFTTTDYANAYKLIPLILFSYFLYGENEFYNLGIQIRNKTYITGIIMLVGGGTNIILNALLISKWGMYGAAIATLISYVIINIISLIISVPLYKVKYDFKNAIKAYLITIGLCAIYYVLSTINNNLIIEMFYNVVLLSIYVILCIVLKVVNIKQVSIYKKKLLRKLKIKLCK